MCCVQYRAYLHHFSFELCVCVVMSAYTTSLGFNKFQNEKYVHFSGFEYKEDDLLVKRKFSLIYFHVSGFAFKNNDRVRLFLYA